jgi:iron(III) transport system substrate-binding protein
MLKQLVSPGHFVPAGILISAVLFSFSAAAQTAPASDNWETVVAAARKEGSVQIYSNEPTAAMNRIVAGFRQAYPDIKIAFIRNTTGALIAKIEQERAASVDGADVAMNSEASWFWGRGEEGALLKPFGPGATSWPAGNTRAGLSFQVAFNPYVIVYNKTLVKEAPKDYADLLKPEFKGKVGATEAVSPTSISLYDWLEKTQDKDYLIRLKAQRPRLYNGVEPVGQAVASGEVSVGNFAVPSSVNPLIAQGAPIEYVLPNPGLGSSTWVGALKWAKRPNAALVLVDYILSRDGQTAWHGKGESASPLPGISGSLDAKTIFAFDPAQYTGEVLAAYRQHFNSIMK